MATKDEDQVHQVIELMPRDEWNIKPSVPQWRKQTEPSTGELLQKNITNMVQSDMRAEKGTVVAESDEDCSSEDEDFRPISTTSKTKSKIKADRGRVEHYAVDNLDLSVFKPRQVQRDGLLDALKLAFNNHHPIVFSPDLVYGYLAKGIAIHINKYSKELRDLYVSHAGKQELIYINDSFVRGSRDNDWGDMFKSFADQLKAGTKGNSVVQNDLKFSTSTPMTEAHRHVLAMESMKSYFDYKCLTRCGISCVILEGTAADWELLQNTVTKQLTEINNYCDSKSAAKRATLKWWSPAVEVLLDNFVATYKAREKDQELSEDLKLWWSTIYKYNAAHGSGQVATITGWVNIFFPYLGPDKQNPWVVFSSPFIADKSALRRKLEDFYAKPPSHKRDYRARRKAEPGDVKVTDYPSYTASVPFKWSYMGTDFHLKALIGHSMLAQVAVKDAEYPEGTLKLFPVWVLYYRE